MIFIKKTIWIAILISVFSHFSSDVLADTHSLSGCVYVLDTREDSDNKGSFLPLSGLPMRVWFTVAGVDFPAVGTMMTNSSGCFSGNLSGVTVPEETSIKVGPLMQNPQWMITNEDWPYFIYDYRFTNSVSVTKGASADFGDMGVLDTLGVDHGVFLLSRTMSEGVDLYESKTSDVWSGYQTISLRFPQTTNSAEAYNNGDGIYFSDAAKAFKRFTLFHEWGHWIAMRDASSYDLPDYCLDYTDTIYPYYSYSNDLDVRPTACSHASYSYENENAAHMEGFADFYAYLLMSHTGDSNDWYDEKDLMFWGQHNEGLVTSTLEDLVDANNESVTYRHAYQNYGSKHLVFETGKGPWPSSPAINGQNGSYIFYVGDDHHSIYRRSISTGKTKALYMSLPWIVADLAADDSNNLCISALDDSYGNARVECANTLGSSSWTRVDWPSDIHSSKVMMNIALNDGELFVHYYGYGLYRGVREGLSSSKEELGSPKGLISIFPYLFPPSWSHVTWTKYIDEPDAATETWSDFLADHDAGQLYIAGTTIQDSVEQGEWIKACSLSETTCTPQIVIGSETQYGYRVGKGEESLIELKKAVGDHVINPNHNLVKAGAYLYLIDVNGITRYDSSTGVLEPYVYDEQIWQSSNQISEQYKAYHNELHRLSIAPDIQYFATDGTHFLIQENDTDLYTIDDSEPGTVEYFCGTDTVTLPASDVVHMYLGRNYGGDFNTALASVSGLSTAGRESVSQINWLDFSNSQKCVWQEPVIVKDARSASEASSSRTKHKKKNQVLGGCLSIEDDQEPKIYKPGQEQIAPLVDITAEEISVSDPKKVYPAASELSDE